MIDSSDGSELMSATPLSNCLTVVLVEPGVESFVKYLSAGAPADRIDFVCRHSALVFRCQASQNISLFLQLRCHRHSGGR